jgi:hypothetical protein
MGLNVYQRDPDDYHHGLYMIPKEFPHVFLIEVSWPDTHASIRDWCVAHVGEAGLAQDWCYNSASIWFRHAHHAIEFKLRWT